MKEILYIKDTTTKQNKKQLTSSSLLVSLKDFSNVSILCILALSVSS